MNKIKIILIILAVICIAAFACLAVLGAFAGFIRTKITVNSPVFIILWIAIVVIVFISLFFLGNPFRRTGLFLIFIGIIFIIAGGLAGSTDANILMNKYFKTNKVHKGIMQLYKGQIQNIALLNNFDIEKAPQFGTIGVLPFSIKLVNFRVEFYEPGILYVENLQKKFWKIEVKEGVEQQLGPDSGSIKILKVFKNLQLPTINGQLVARDQPDEGINRAVEIEYTTPYGNKIKKYIYAEFPNPPQPDDKIKLSYLAGVIKDLYSDIEIVKDGRTVKSATIELNKPLHYGGYYIYQFDFDRSGKFSVLQVVSDTGLSAVFVGFAILLIGVFWYFWFQILANKIRRKT